MKADLRIIDVDEEEMLALSEDLMNRMLDLVLREETLRIPTLMAGWKPEESGQQACLEFCRGELFGKLPHAEPTEFEVHGGSFSGFVLKGDVVFEEVLEEFEEVDPDVQEIPITKEQMKRLATAMATMECTVAWGMIDGFMVLYFGNDPQSLGLVDHVEDSLAADPSLGWTRKLSDESPLMVGYVSKPVLKILRENFNYSLIWGELAKAVGDPIEDVRTIAGLLEGIGKQSRLLSDREVNPWSMALLRDRGYRLETRGGWLDPALDYDTPLRMVAAASASRPMIRYHSMRNRERVEQEWQMMELLGALTAAVADELFVAFSGDESKREMMDRVFDECREIGRMYREEFHPGIGDEIAFVMDMEGEIPPIPRISQDVIDQYKGPRFLYARPILDRQKVGAAGSSIVTQWRRLTKELSEKMEFEIPAIVPQKIESNGVATWYPPAPFIGGDFVPGVSLNDDLWMMGSSTSLTKNFVQGYSEDVVTGETGRVIQLGKILTYKAGTFLNSSHAG